MRINPSSKAVLTTLALAAGALSIPALSLAGGGYGAGAGGGGGGGGGEGGGGTRAVLVDAKLKGQTEVPGPGDPNGRGNVDIKLKKQKRKVCFDLTYRRLNGASAAHIHKGAEDVAGPVKVLLFEADPELPGADRVKECVRESRKQIRKIARHPERFYVNVHNAEYPDGAIRGQLDFTPAR